MACFSRQTIKSAQGSRTPNWNGVVRESHLFWRPVCLGDFRQWSVQGVWNSCARDRPSFQGPKTCTQVWCLSRSRSEDAANRKESRISYSQQLMLPVLLGDYGLELEVPITTIRCSDRHFQLWLIAIWHLIFVVCGFYLKTTLLNRPQTILLKQLVTRFESQCIVWCRIWGIFGWTGREWFLKLLWRKNKLKVIFMFLSAHNWKSPTCPRWHHFQTAA